MKTLYKNILAAALCTSIMQSCIMSTIVEDINQTAGNKETPLNSKTNTLHTSYLILQIQNNAPNTTLHADSMEICNILLPGETAPEPLRGNIALAFTPDSSGQNCIHLPYGTSSTASPATLPAQTLTPWNPTELPHTSPGTHLKIHGKICTYLPDNTPMPLYEGVMYVPLPGTITANRNNILLIELYPNCPLYCITNGKTAKVLQTIQFSVSVENWQNGQAAV